jgi:hypothetical protein
LKIDAGSSGRGAVSTVGKIEVTINVFGGCNYEVEPGKALGITTEGTGTAVQLAANAVAELSGGGILCPPTVKWVAEYVLTAPSSTTFYVSSS